MGDATFFFTGSKFVKDLKSTDFDSSEPWKIKDKGCCAILFYCAWCPHCRSAKDEWNKFGEIATFMKVRGMNCEAYKGHIAKMNQDMPSLVRGYPTILFYKDGEPVEHYMGDRTSNKLLKRAMCICQGICE